jgi:hypothetical protein
MPWKLVGQLPWRNKRKREIQMINRDQKIHDLAIAYSQARMTQAFLSNPQDNPFTPIEAISEDDFPWLAQIYELAAEKLTNIFPVQSGWVG